MNQKINMEQKKTHKKRTILQNHHASGRRVYAGETEGPPFSDSHRVCVCSCGLTCVFLSIARARVFVFCVCQMCVVTSCCTCVTMVVSMLLELYLYGFPKHHPACMVPCKKCNGCISMLTELYLYGYLSIHADSAPSPL